MFKLKKKLINLKNRLAGFKKLFSTQGIRKLFHEHFLNFRFKKWLFYRSLNKKIIIGAGIFIGIIGLYFLLAFRSLSPAELALAEIKGSYQQEIICHEDCTLARQKAEEAIVNELSLGFENNNLKNYRGSSLERHLKNSFFSAEENLEFKQEIIAIWKLAAGVNNPPEYMKNYLGDEAGDVNVQAAIIKSFNLLALNPENNIGENFLISGVDASGNGNNALTYYFNLLESRRNIILKQAIVDALGSYPEKTRDFSERQLTAIKRIILDPRSDKHLRQSLVLLLSDYYPLFSVACADILREIYQSNNINDTVSQLFAVDILNRLALENLNFPAVSALEWQEYYNN